jgi:hypothetical protein
MDFSSVSGWIFYMFFYFGLGSGDNHFDHLTDFPPLDILDVHGCYLPIRRTSGVDSDYVQLDWAIDY